MKEGEKVHGRLGARRCGHKIREGERKGRI